MKDLSIQQLTNLIMAQAKVKGFGTKPIEVDVAEKIVLVHSEISEAFEAYRHKKIRGVDAFEGELCSAILRLLHLCGVFDINVEQMILKKVKRNKSRQWRWRQMNEKHS
ncbi:MAG: hypothetical protein WC480_01295 [Patescibacteria group bacterium]